MATIDANKVWTNADGLTVRFDKEQGKLRHRATVHSTAGGRKEMRFTLDLADLGANGVSFTNDLNRDGTLDGWDDNQTALPSGAIIESAKVIVTTAAAGGTSITVGTHTRAGAATDADGFVTAAAGAVANLTANAVLTGAGAQVGTRLTAEAVPSVTAAGTFTAGTIEVVITYLDVR